MHNEAVICGSKGYIRIHEEFWHPNQVSISLQHGSEQPIEIPKEDLGMGYEAQHVMDCIKAGKTESDVMRFQDSRDLMALMDALRAEWGLKYPGE